MRTRWFILALVAWLGVPALLLAQSSTATVHGVVTDESKSVLPGVTVTATEVETGRKQVSVTEARGDYQLASLPPGTYTIQAELAGFAVSETPRVELLVGQNAAINFVLAEDHVGFEVSLASAQKSGHRISARMLAVARRVVPKGS